ncbi:MAG: nitroreductase family protein [Candidatus Paceibacterota bacterium]
MEVQEAIRSRRSVREWADTPVSDEQIKLLVDSGRFSPSPLNSQPWHFVIVRNKERLGELAEKAQHGSFLASAPVAIIALVDQEAEIDQWLQEREQHFSSGACAVQNMQLAAWDLGLGCCWVTMEESFTKKILSIPDAYRVLGSLAVGFPKDKPKPHSEEDRHPLESFISWEEFGQNS